MLFPKQTYVERRRVLAERIGSGLILLFGNNNSPANYPGNAYKWRQDSTFLYYFGLQREGLCGVIDCDEARVWLIGDDIDIDDIVCRLENAGFADIRAAQTEEYVVVSLSCDSYKLPVEGLSRARQILEDALEENPVKIKVICTDRNVPQLTMTFDPSSGRWSTTRRLDESWDVVKVERRTASSIGRTNILFYPQISIKNLIINQVYQTLWQISPAVEVSLWPGMKMSYQLKYPLFNDGFGDAESKVHPGMMAISQSFRDPWHLNVFGKVTAGVFSSNRYGLALEAWYYFPGERLSVDTQLAMLANCYFDGFIFKLL